jgi:pimeloyl-ACP methyl ester carboxylesterase
VVTKVTWSANSMPCHVDSTSIRSATQRKFDDGDFLLSPGFQGQVAQIAFAPPNLAPAVAATAAHGRDAGPKVTRMATSAAQPPVLLLHGMATSAARTWGENGWLELLRDAKRPALAVDLMGHGDAPKPHDPAAYEALEQAVVDVLPDEPVDAIGFSLGARTILAIAGRHPERFRKIVTGGVGRNLFEVDKERAASIQRGINGQPDDEDPSSQYFSQLADSPEVDREALIALMHRKSSWPVNRETLKAVTHPVLVCIGDGDWAGPGDPLVEALPNATLKVLRRADHYSTP